MSKIIFVVGHSNWGKSKTLKCLTNDSRYVKTYTINDINWFIRRMSNDDYSENYCNFMKNLNAEINPNVIAAFCPNFEEKRNEETIEILNSLKNKGYNLYFWVIEHQFVTKKKMDSSFINELKNFGEVEIYSKCEEADLRALALKDFIKKYT
jgi:hypothetical protein